MKSAYTYISVIYNQIIYKNIYMKPSQYIKVLLTPFYIFIIMILFMILSEI